MATARKMKSGNWRCLAYVGMKDGKRQYKSFTAPTKKEAELLAAQYEGENDSEKVLTLGEAIDRYIDEKDALLSPTTIAGYRKIKRNYFTDLMETDIGSITVSMLQSSVNDMSKRRSVVTRRPLSSKTINSSLSFIISVLDYNDIDLSYKKITRPQKQKIEYKTPDVENIKRIIAASKGSEIEIPILLAVWLSLRMSEITGLKWENVCKDHIVVENARVYADGITYDKNTKTTHSERSLPLPGYIYDKIRALPKDGEYLFKISGQAIYKKFARMLKREGIPHCRFHDLRHANASIMLMLDIPERYAMERGGWITTEMYKRVYGQTFKSEEQKVAATIDDFFEGLINATQNATQTP